MRKKRSPGPGSSAEEARVIALRTAHLTYSKLKLAVLYRQRYGTTISSCLLVAYKN
jgi:hypothetical protein